ncbi:MAG TPA: hypothetical protein VMT91_04420 [Anaerolineales bacterium]|nr:hypothetical protein [Anaerolineales bacterium]
MNNPDTDLLFPPRVLPALLELRGEPWRKLVTAVLEAGPDSLDQMAFVLMMARLNNCVTCNSDSFRAMSGCTTCAKLSLKRFHDPDEALVAAYQSAKIEVGQYLQKRTGAIHEDLLSFLPNS